MSDNSNVAAVDQTGLVTAVGTGNCRITAYDSNDRYLKSSLDIAVNVDSGEVNTIPVESISITSTTGGNIVDIGAGLKVQATITPDNATNKALTWTSSSDEVATVIPDVTNDYTIINGVSAGTATIYATATDGSGIQAQFEVTVNGNSEQPGEDDSGSGDNITYTEEDLIDSMNLAFLDDIGRPVSELNGQGHDIMITFNKEIEPNFNISRFQVQAYNDSGFAFEQEYLTENMINFEDGNIVKHITSGLGFTLDTDLESVHVYMYDSDNVQISTGREFTVEELGLTPGLQANLDLLLEYNNNTKATELNNDKVNAFVYVNDEWYFAKEPTTCVIRQYNESKEQIAFIQSINHTSTDNGYAVFTFEGNFKLDAQLRSVRVEIYDVDSNTLATDTFTVEELSLSAKSAVEITGLEIIEQVTSNLTLSVGDTNETKVSVLPKGAEPGVDYKAITVESSNSDVMSVAIDLENFSLPDDTYINKFILTALATGNTTITYKAIGLNDEVLATLTTDYVVE